MEALLMVRPENDVQKNMFHEEILKVYLSGNQIMEAAEYAREKIGHSQLSLTLVLFYFIFKFFPSLYFKFNIYLKSLLSSKHSRKLIKEDKERLEYSNQLKKSFLPNIVEIASGDVSKFEGKN